MSLMPLHPKEIYATGESSRKGQLPEHPGFPTAKFTKKNGKGFTKPPAQSTSTKICNRDSKAAPRGEDQNSK